MTDLSLSDLLEQLTAVLTTMTASEELCLRELQRLRSRAANGMAQAMAHPAVPAPPMALAADTPVATQPHPHLASPRTQGPPASEGPWSPSPPQVPWTPPSPRAAWTLPPSEMMQAAPAAQVPLPPHAAWTPPVPATAAPAEAAWIPPAGAGLPGTSTTTEERPRRVTAARRDYDYFAELDEKLTDLRQRYLE